MLKMFLSRWRERKRHLRRYLNRQHGTEQSQAHRHGSEQLYWVTITLFDEQSLHRMVLIFEISKRGNLPGSSPPRSYWWVDDQLTSPKRRLWARPEVKHADGLSDYYLSKPFWGQCFFKSDLTNSTIVRRAGLSKPFWRHIYTSYWSESRGVCFACK